MFDDDVDEILLELNEEVQEEKDDFIITSIVITKSLHRELKGSKPLNKSTNHEKTAGWHLAHCSPNEEAKFLTVSDLDSNTSYNNAFTLMLLANDSEASGVCSKNVNISKDN